MTKRLLIVGPQFFGYRDAIAGEFRSRGIEVDTLLDTPSSGVTYKSLTKIDQRLTDRSVARYARTVESRVAGERYDAVLFVGGMTIPFTRAQFESIRGTATGIMALYLWDSLCNSPRVSSALDLFDVIASFEPLEHARSMHLPLFFTQEFEQAAHAPLSEAEYDACFIGSVHQVAKFAAVTNMVDVLRSNGMNVFTRFYVPSASALMLRKMQCKLYRRHDLAFTTDPIGRDELAAIYARSACVLDAPQSGQSGLTMRTIEAIGAGRRLVTTNEAVRAYDFFKYGDVLIANDTADPADLCSFVSDRVRNIPDSLRTTYSLSAWVTVIGNRMGLL